MYTKNISVNSAVYASADESGNLFVEKRHPSGKFVSQASILIKKGDIDRMLSFGNVGVKVMAENISTEIEIDYSTAKEIVRLLK